MKLWDSPLNITIIVPSTNKMYKVIIVLIFIFQLALTIEPLTGLGIVALGSALGLSLFCNFSECCIDEYIPINFTALEFDLNESLFGQHIVIDSTLYALKAHYSNLEKSKKPLVLTFHGTPGTGKNFVADKIAKHIYTYGVDSKYVHKFIGRLHFPEEGLVDLYKKNVKDTVISIVSLCPRALFIFDEIDKTPPGVLELLTPLLEHHTSINGVNFRHAIFIFLTNTGGVEIGNVLVDKFRSGKMRNETTLKDYEKICQQSAFQTKGGLQKAGAISASLIDHYIPFLPMERYHIEQCIQAEFRLFGESCSKTDLEVVMGEVLMEDSTGMFAESGCKRIDKQVGAHIQMNKMKQERQNK